jgi:signal transduction histidine kinase
MRRARPYAPFWICLLLALWLPYDALFSAPFDTASLIALVPAGILWGLGLTLLCARPQRLTACLLALCLVALAVLERGNIAGLWQFNVLGRSSIQLIRSHFVLSDYLWALALGLSPLLFAFALTSEARIPAWSPERRLSNLALIGCAVLAQLLCAFAARQDAFHLVGASSAVSGLLTPHHRLLLYSAPLTLTLQFAAFLLIYRHYRRWGEARNRALILLFGAALLFVALVIISDTLARLDLYASANRFAYLTSNALAYLIPILLVYAIEKYALFDIYITLRRTLQYGILQQVMNLLLLLPAVGLAFFLGLRVNPAPIRSGPLSPLHNAIWNDGSLIFTLLGGTFVLIMALRVPLFRWFDQTYFGDVNSTQQTLTQTGRALPRLMDTWQIGQELLNGIEATLHPVNALFVVEEESGPRCLAARCLTGFVPPRDLPPGLVSAAPLQISAVPSLDNRYGLQQAAWLREMPARAAALLYEAEIRLYVPIRDEEQVYAALLLGEKASGLAYTPEELELLQGLAPQTALALLGARLHREIMQRRTQELTASSVGFVEMVERERRLLAADLHDQTLPELRCLLIDLEHRSEMESQGALANQDSLSKEPLLSAEKMAENLRQTIQNIRDIMESLRPSALEMLGLLPALENELRKSAGRARPPLIPQFHAEEGAVPPGISDFDEMSIYRIAQEAINNACRHAQATCIRVEIGFEGADWVLRVEDDGRGMPPEPIRSQGRGLDNMRYRARLIGARLRWERIENGRGTRVELRLPRRQKSA